MITIKMTTIKFKHKAPLPLGILGWPPFIKTLSDKELKITLGFIMFAPSLWIPTLGGPLIEDGAIFFNRCIKGKILLIGQWLW